MSRSVTPSLFQYLKALLRRTRVASLEGPSKAGSFELGPILELAAPAVTVLLSVGLGRLASRTASGIQVALALCAAAGCGQSLGVGPGSESPRTWDPAAAPLPDIGPLAEARPRAHGWAHGPGEYSEYPASTLVPRPDYTRPRRRWRMESTLGAPDCRPQ